MKKSTTIIILLLLIYSIGNSQTRAVTQPPAKTVKHFDELLSLALLPAKINTSPLPEYDLDKLDYALSEGITRTLSGTLWALWVAGGDNDKAFVVLASSKDDGQTWSKPRVVIDPHLPNTFLGIRSLVANIWTDPKGRLWVFYDQAVGYFDGRGGVWATVCENPDSEQLIWSEPKRLWNGAAINKPIVTSQGEWLLPVSLWPRKLINSVLKDRFHDLDQFRGANVLVSKDEGKTWKLRGNTVKIPDSIVTVDEHMLIERKDGSLWMTIRTLDGMWESFSNNKGNTWSRPQVSKIYNASGKHFITRLKSGRLLLIKHGQEIHRAKDSPRLSRKQLSAFLSDDDGKSWSKGLLIMAGSGSYPDGVQEKDGTIYICYDYDRWFSAEIWMARFTEKDILAGKLINPESNNAILISKATGLTEKERAIRKEHRAKKKRVIQKTAKDY